MPNVPCGMSVSRADWKRERQAAARLCRELDLEEELETARRSWISKTWPCYIRSGFEREKLLDDKFTPEWPLSPTSENFIRNFVRRSFNEFLEDEDSLGLLLEELSDAELVRALPFLLKGLNIRALQEVLSILSTWSLKKTMNRGWLERRILKKLGEVRVDDGEPMAEPLEQVVAVVRDHRSARKYSPVGFLSDLPSLPAAAAEAALTKLDKLSLQTLRVMNEVISGKPASEVCVLKPKYLGNKERYMSSIKKYATNFVQGDSIPPTLQKALLVMSLSARATVGEDGNLRHCVDKPYQGSEALQNQMLIAHSLIDKLDPQQLETAYLEITEQTKEDVQSRHRYFDINSGSKKESLRKHPNDFRQSLRRILFDYIIRSGIMEIPGHVRQAVAKVNLAADMKKSHKSQRGRLLLKLKQQFDDEVSCVADFSSQLRDLIVDGCGFSGSQNIHGLGMSADGITDMCFSRMDPGRPDANNQEGPDEIDTEVSDELDVQFCDTSPTDGSRYSKWNDFFTSGAGTGAQGTILDDVHGRDDCGDAQGDTWIGVSSPLVNPSDSSCSSVGARKGSKLTQKLKRRSSEASSLHSKASTVAVESRPKPLHVTSGSDSEDSNPLFFVRDDWNHGDHEVADAPKPIQDSPSFVIMENSYTARELKRQRVADKAAVLMYIFVGRAMEEATSRPESGLLDPARKYLAGGYAAHGHDPALKNINGTVEEEMLLRIVETLPAVSKRALDAVRQRMSFC